MGREFAIGLLMAAHQVSDEEAFQILRSASSRTNTKLATLAVLAGPALAAPPSPSDPAIERDRFVRRVLLAAGCSEALTFSFIDAAAAAPFADAGTIVPIENPLSAQFSVLRPSLLPGLIDAHVHAETDDEGDGEAGGTRETGTRTPEAA